MKLYQTRFSLTNCVNDMYEAQKYLNEDDMTKYLLNDSRCKDPSAIVAIWWSLEEIDGGHIWLKTTRGLSKEELDGISEWVSGQNSDGLGEGFEQQPFAETEIERDDWDEYDGWGEDRYEYASFDWETNDYRFEEVK